MKGIDECVRAMPLRFRGPRIDKKAGKKSSKRGEQNEQPEMRRGFSRERNQVFSRRLSRRITGKIFEGKERGPFQEKEDNSGHERAQGADRRPVNKPLEKSIPSERSGEIGEKPPE